MNYSVLNYSVKKMHMNRLRMNIKRLNHLVSALCLSVALAPAVPAHQITWEHTRPEKMSEAEKAALNKLVESVEYSLLAGKGPSDNRYDHIVVPNYKGESWDELTLQDFIGDYHYRTKSLSDLLGFNPAPHGAEDPETTFISSRPLNRHIYDRYLPFFKVWRMESIRLRFPVYGAKTHKGFIFDATKGKQPFAEGELTDAH